VHKVILRSMLGMYMLQCTDLYMLGASVVTTV